MFATPSSPQDRKEHQSEVRELTRQIEELRREEKQTTAGLQKKLRHSEREAAVRLQELRGRWEEERSAARLLGSQCHAQAAEISRLHDEHLRLEEELSKVRRKLERSDEELQSKVRRDFTFPKQKIPCQHYSLNFYK